MEITLTGKDQVTPYTWGDGCLAWTLVDAEDLSVKSEVMPPGTREALHYHAAARQFFYILRGNAEFISNGKTISVQPGTGVHIPPGVSHYIRNSDDTELEFLVISQPNTKNDRILCNEAQ